MQNRDEIVQDAVMGRAMDEAVPGDPARVLVALLCPIGDTLLATPALAALRNRFPDAEITALVYRANAGILEGNPAIDKRLVLDAGATTSRLTRIARGTVATEWSAYGLM